MSHAAFSGWAAIRTGVYLPALVIAFATTPGSCSCRFDAKPRGEFAGDFSDWEVLGAAAEGGTALELNLLERVAAPDDARRLHDFGREAGSPLGRARDVVDKAFHKAEADLQTKWPKGKLSLRRVNVSVVGSLYDASPPEMLVDDGGDDVQRYDRDYIAESVQQLREAYPDRAAGLPDVEKLKADAKKANEAGKVWKCESRSSEPLSIGMHRPATGRRV